MIRRYNYTDRLKIPRENMKLAWVDDGSGCLSFSCDLNLELDRLLNPDGRVFVEAYSGSDVMRFDFGTVSHREPPGDTRLIDFPPGLKPLFRVRVVEPDDECRILAWADRVVPLAPDEVESGRRSILPVEYVDLGQRVWDLRIESNKFVLQLNASIKEPHDIAVLAREADFVALVYPAVVRQILTHLLLGPESDAVEPDDEWLNYAATLTGSRAPSADDGASEEEFADDVEAWIHDVVEAFCNQQYARDNFVVARKDKEPSNV
jgi:hypothetical protein